MASTEMVGTQREEIRMAAMGAGKSFGTIGTHLCGSVYNQKDASRCPSLNYVTEDGQKHGKRPLQKYNVYCMAEGRCRSLGNVATFTGNSPTWCPRRKELEQNG